MAAVPAPTVGLSFTSFFATDMVGLFEYYRGVFGLPEVEELRSEHFRGLQIGDTVIGFSRAETAYDLLELPRPTVADNGVRTFITFETQTDDQVDAMLEVAIAAGGTLVQAPHRTYYGAWQAVVLDPEGNAFRINHLP
ncbi:glyoxalase [Nakamurella sp. YIM 132087]|uniref:Glyoxalase n=1 Tax=Nakamurella alba TaxID=2665158 RepID=A0A7K1FTI7_9ACTN|nr:VOC family protein [Nakamurella alba]MTD17400.1 glyoxalase [Nakamurella alba]